MPLTVSLGTSAATFALFAAAYMLAVALERSEDESLPEPLEGERFSLAAPVHVAAILVAGPWAAALVAVLGTLAVRPFRHDGPRALIARSVGLAATAIGAGYAFELSGRVVGSLRLPEDVLPVVLAGFVYWTARTVLEGLLKEHAAVNPDFLVGTAEIGLGLVLAFAAAEELWLAAALVPVLLLLDRPGAAAAAPAHRAGRPRRPSRPGRHRGRAPAAGRDGREAGAAARCAPRPGGRRARGLSGSRRARRRSARRAAAGTRRPRGRASAGRP